MGQPFFYFKQQQDNIKKASINLAFNFVLVSDVFKIESLCHPGMTSILGFTSRRNKFSIATRVPRIALGQVPHAP